MSECDSERSAGRLPGWAIGFVIGGAIADGATTHQAFGRGAIESNPLYDGLGEGGAIAVHAALTAGELVALRHLAKRRPRLATGLAIALGAISFAAAAHNSGVCRGEDRCQ